ncbi:hypothetical protein [Amycolatopsis ultiminotia]
MERKLAVVVAALCLGLSAGCGEAGVPAPASSSAAASPQPHPMTADDRDFLRRIFEAKYHVAYPLTDACPSGVSPADTACGTQVKALGETADAVVRVMGDYLPDSQTKKIIDDAETVHKAVETTAGLGCFGLSGKGNPASEQDRAKLCPQVVTAVGLSYLEFQGDLR